MNLEIQPTTITRRRAVWLGLLAGIGTHFLAGFVLSAGSVAFDHAWAGITDTQYLPTREIPRADTPLWLSLQILGFFASVLSGMAAVRWSPLGSWKAPVGIFGLAILVVLCAQFPATNSIFRQVVWVLATPLGIAIGVLWYKHRERGLTGRSS